jgi:hypothetical protein
VKVYSDVPAQRFGQFFGDVMLVLWAVVCASIGLVVYRVTNALGAPGRKAAEAGDSLAGGIRGLAEPAGEIPAVGDKLRAPLDGAASAADRLAQAGRDQAHAVEQLAIVLGLVTAGLPILFAVLIWLPRRIRFSRRASAAQRFVDNAADLELFALRAMANQPMHRLARVSDDPVTAWRDGDPDVVRALAALELEESGLRVP